MKPYEKMTSEEKEKVRKQLRDLGLGLTKKDQGNEDSKIRESLI